ncbi:hypothetical protein R6Q57_014387 [Mikania cordata]
MVGITVSMVVVVLGGDVGARIPKGRKISVVGMGRWWQSHYESGWWQLGDDSGLCSGGGLVTEMDGVQNVDNDLAEDLDVVHNNSSSNSVLFIDLSQYFQTRSTHVSNNEAASEVNPPAVVANEDEMFQGEFDYDEDDPDYNKEGSETGTEDYGGESD